MTKDQIRAVFLANGFTVKPGETDLKAYVFEAADELLRQHEAIRTHDMPRPDASDPAPISRAEWIARAKAFYLESGDDEATATSCARYLCNEQSWAGGEVSDPLHAAQEDVQGRPHPGALAAVKEVKRLREELAATQRTLDTALAADRNHALHAELGRTAMRFVDRAGDVHPGIDDADRICAQFHAAMSETMTLQGVFDADLASAAPNEANHARQAAQDRWQQDNDAACWRAFVDAVGNGGATIACDDSHTLSNGKGRQWKVSVGKATASRLSPGNALYQALYTHFAGHVPSGYGFPPAITSKLVPADRWVRQRPTEADRASAQGRARTTELVAADAVWAIFYDDHDRRPEIVVSERAARARFEAISTSWNAHLFVKVASNSHDDRYANANATVVQAPADADATTTTG